MTNKAKELIIWAGVSCAGKTHLMRQIQQHELPEIWEALDLAGIAEWSQWDAGKLSNVQPAQEKRNSASESTFHSKSYHNDLIRLDELVRGQAGAVDKLLVHYDLYAHKAKKGEFKLLELLLRSAEKTIVITLTASRLALVRRVFLKLYRALLQPPQGSSGKRPGLNRLSRKIFRLVRKSLVYLTGGCDRIYRGWYQALERFEPSEHWILDTTVAPRIRKVAANRRHSNAE